MKWSPDQELVVFATGNHTLLSMTKNWEQLEEVPITASELSIANESNTNNSNAATASRPIISWRGDGKYFAVNSVDPDSGKRWIRVWERACIFSSRSEDKVLGLSDTLAWRPDGSIIASHQYLANKKETNIVFFERNGLQHYQFLLEKGEGKVYSLSWNNASEVLAVHAELPSRPFPVVQLWFRNNYHWYLKQELRFANSPVDYMTWDVESPLRLHVFCRDGTYHVYEYTWDHHISVGNTSANPSLAAVIDGEKLLLTPFRYAVVPPPISTDSLSFDAPVHGVALSKDSGMLVQLANGNMQVFEYDTSAPVRPPKFGLPPKTSYILNATETNINQEQLRLVTLISKNAFVAVQSTQVGSGDVYVKVFVQDGKVTNTTRFSFKEKILRIHHHPFTGRIFIQTENGTIFEDLLNNEYAPRQWSRPSFPLPCPHFCACMMGGGDEEVLVGLTDRGVLYFSNQVASSSCTSFFIHDEFILFTTYTHQLRLISLQHHLPEVINVASVQTPTDDSVRDIERGAKLVCAVPQDTRVILQMPRGNLEGIYPRALVLSNIRTLLNQHDYKQAVFNARKHKIDLNIIYDHNPSALLESMEEFVRKVNNNDYIILFLSSLRNEDITKTLYTNYHGFGGHADGGSSAATDDLIKDKINLVCKRLRQALEAIDSKRFIEPILTTYAKHQPPELEDALNLIRSIRDQPGEDAATAKAASDKALAYLIFLADVNQLYDVALGMYDFDLVIMVAQKSQKDPKEYLPFLANLQRMEPNYQQYSIDLHLGRYEKALRHLSKAVLAPDASEALFTECMSLIKNQKLYQLALDLFSGDAAKRNAILEAFGAHLEAYNQYDQAGMAFLECNNLQRALAAFTEAGNFYYVFPLAQQLGYSKSDERSLAYDVSNVLQKHNKTREAAQVLREYADDSEQAITLLTETHYWDEAIRMAYAAQRTDLIKTNIHPALLEAFDNRMHDLDETRERFQKYYDRLVEMRTEKQEPIRIHGEEHDDTASNADAFSDTSSIASGYSGVTLMSQSSRLSRTSRTSRRNKIKLKKGSLYEETNLVDRLRGMAPKETFQEDIARLLRALVYFKHFDKARALQKKFGEFMELCRSSAEVVNAPLMIALPGAQEGDQANGGSGAGQKKKPIKKMEEILGNFDWKVAILE
eukprot:GEZU01022499.1.p1 GENE.GEZU01022499.1~~GEZU01022499.1.p1  ORF type:complete len:1152 (+),score=352.16 GEZU01022499.1:132-3587(+)